MLIGVGLLVGVAAVAAFMINGMPTNLGQNATPVPTVAPVASPAPNDATGGAQMDAQAREVMVTGQEFSFSPETLTFKQGETIKLVFKNTGKMPHDFVVDELGIKTKVIQGGQEDTVTFTVSKKGTFESYCSVGNHRAQGMVGSVVVE